MKGFESRLNKIENLLPDSRADSEKISQMAEESRRNLLRALKGIRERLELKSPIPPLSPEEEQVQVKALRQSLRDHGYHLKYREGVDE